MQIDLEVQPAGKATAKAVLTQEQVDAIRGAPGRGQVNLCLAWEGEVFRTCISVYRGEWMFVVNKAMRAAGLLPGATYAVQITRDDEPKRADPAPDVRAALQAHPAVWAAWEGKSTSWKRQQLANIEGAKRPETRARRIGKVVAELGG